MQLPLPNNRQNAINLQISRYFTGLTCIYGHTSIRWTSSGKCISCHYEKKPLLKIKKKSQDEKKKSQSERSRNWYEKNKIKAVENARHWKKENPEKVRLSESKSRQNPESKSIRFMRDSLRRVLKIEKKGRTEKLLGYTRHELMNHIEKQFTKKMSWANYGKYWEIDHITPVSVLIKSGIADPSFINCLSNLRPLCKIKNRAKSAKVEVLL